MMAIITRKDIQAIQRHVCSATRPRSDLGPGFRNSAPMPLRPTVVNTVGSTPPFQSVIVTVTMIMTAVKDMQAIQQIACVSIVIYSLYIYTRDYLHYCYDYYR